MGLILAIVIIGLLLLMGYSFYYVYNHRDEVFEVTGIEIPLMPWMKQKRVKKVQKHRPNAKAKYFHQNSKSQVVEPQARSQPRKQKTENKSEKIIYKKTSLSDYTIETDNSPIKDMCLGQNGIIASVSKDGKCGFYVTSTLDEAHQVLTQNFLLDSNEITSISLLHEDQMKICYALKKNKTLVVSKLKLNKETESFEPTEPLVFSDLYTKALNYLQANPSGKYIVLVVDHNIIKIINTKGDVLCSKEFENLKITSFLYHGQSEHIYIGTNNSIEVVRVANNGEHLELVCTIPSKSQIVSLAYCSSTKELVSLSSNNSVTVYNSKIQTKKVREVWEVPSSRIVVASDSKPYIAIICGKSAIKVVSMKDGSIIGEVSEAHKGEIHHAIFSQAVEWLFLASKSQPNIESFKLSEK